MRVKEDFFNRGAFKVGNGSSTRFWEDTWLGDKPLAVQYPNLFNICHRKEVTVENVKSSTPLNIGFRRRLTGNLWVRWDHRVQQLMQVQLAEQKDIFCWGLTTSRQFSVKSMYLDMLNGHTRFFRKYIWKIKVPLKIRIFMWFLQRKVILTKDNLAKKKLAGM